MTDINHGDILIGNGELYIVCRQQLIIPHIVRLDSHKGRTVIRFGVTVSVRATDIYLFCVFSQFVCILPKPFIVPLLESLMSSFAVDKRLFIQLPQHRILFGNLIQIVRNVFRACGYLCTTPG